MKFNNLHVHTEYSLLDGVGAISEWVGRAKELGMDALAITDHGNMNSAQQLIFSCKQNNIKPIVGVEFYIVEDRLIKQKEYKNHITVLAKNTAGYHNLIKLTSIANIDGFYSKPRIDFELLKKYSEGLIILSGCYAGVICQAALNNNKNKAIKEIRKYKEVFGDDYYIEIMLFPHNKFKNIYEKVIKIAIKENVKLVLTNDCHYINKSDSLLQDILLLIKQKKTFKDDTFRFSLKCLWLKSLKEILEVWEKGYKDVLSKKYLKQAIKSTVEIADKVEEYIIDKKNKYPCVYSENKKIDNIEINKLLLAAVKKGWKKRKIKKELKDIYLKRLKYELNIIIDKGMPAYFLILADVINWAEKNNILVGFGRGCFTGNTKVSLLDGTERTMKELAENFKNKSFNVYSCLPNGKIIIGNAKNARVTKIVNKLCIIKLDNGKEIKCTEDHRFMLRNGLYLEAKNLKVGESLMPFYRKENEFGYETFYDNNKKTWFCTHYMNYIKKYKTVIHHKDFNKNNNNPENLRQMPWKEHCILHAKSNSMRWKNPKWRIEAIKRYWRVLGSKQNRKKTSERNKTEKMKKKVSDGQKRIWANPQYREKMLKIMKTYGVNSLLNKAKMRIILSRRIKSEKEINQLIKRNKSLKNREKVSQSRKKYYKTKNGILEKEKISKRMKNRIVSENTKKKISAARLGKSAWNKGKKFIDGEYVNHKIISISFINKKCKMYDIEVEGCNNFALTDGVFVHNSAAGSLLTYLLGIHHVDPIKHKLLFERFINKTSDNMPDIDVDFDARYKETVKQYLIDKYGQDKVGEIVTYGVMKLKMAIKDVARVYGFDYIYINEITKQLGADCDNFSEQKLKKILGGTEAKNKILNLALRIKGQIRHLSVHPAGLIVTPEALTNYIPLQRYKDKILTGWTEGVSRREISALGLVKYDILGLKTLSVISDCIAEIKKRSKLEIELTSIPLDDKKVYKAYKLNLVMGIFQCESSTMQGLIRNLKPKEFEDIIALLALDRPAPLSMGIFEKYLDNRRNKNIYKEFHPIIWDILKSTYGVILYQEQVINLTKILGKLNEAERLVVKKILKKPPTGKLERQVFLEKQDKVGEVFIKNASEKIGKSDAKQMWEDIKLFGLYSFNRSHSCSYALLTNATMWLKSHFPLEFYTGCLNHTSNEKAQLFKEEMKTQGINLLLVDINKSKENFIIENNDIRCGFEFLKGIGKAAKVITDGQPFPAMEHFLQYTALNKSILNKRVILALIKAGAFDKFCERGRALHQYRQKFDRKYIGKCEKLNHYQILSGEADVYGFYAGGFITGEIKEAIENDGCLSLTKGLEFPAKENVTIYAKVDRIFISKKAIFINISNENSKSSIVGWAGVIKKYKDKFKAGDFIIAHKITRNNYKGEKNFIIGLNSKIKKVELGG